MDVTSELHTTGTGQERQRDHSEDSMVLKESFTVGTGGLWCPRVANLLLLASQFYGTGEGRYATPNESTYLHSVHTEPKK